MINAFILCDLFENFRQIMQQPENEALSDVIQFVTPVTTPTATCWAF